MFKKVMKYLIFPGFPIIIFLILPNILQIYWKSNPPDGFYYPGFHISDQNTYTAIFRSVIERGTGITYSYPYSAPGKDNPAVFFQMPFMLLAWFWKISGSILFSWELFRFISGFIFLISFFLTFLKYSIRKMKKIEGPIC